MSLGNGELRRHWRRRGVLNSRAVTRHKGLELRQWLHAWQQEHWRRVGGRRRQRRQSISGCVVSCLERKDDGTDRQPDLLRAPHRRGTGERQARVSTLELRERCDAHLSIPKMSKLEVPGQEDSGDGFGSKLGQGGSGRLIRHDVYEAAERVEWSRPCLTVSRRPCRIERLAKRHIARMCELLHGEIP